MTPITITAYLPAGVTKLIMDWVCVIKNVANLCGLAYVFCVVECGNGVIFISHAEVNLLSSM